MVKSHRMLWHSVRGLYDTRSTTDARPAAAHDAVRVGDEFRVGQILNRTFSVLSRNLLPFCVVTAIAYLPNLLILERNQAGVPQGRVIAMMFIGVILSLILSALSQAIVLFGAFEDMRGRPVDMIASLKVGLSRFLPVIGVALLVGTCSRWTRRSSPGVSGLHRHVHAVCCDAGLYRRAAGPGEMSGAQLNADQRPSLEGFRALARHHACHGNRRRHAWGHRLCHRSDRWRPVKSSSGVHLVQGLSNAIMVVVAYHDLRVVKEGVDTDHIASVFD